MGSSGSSSDSSGHEKMNKKKEKKKYKKKGEKKMVGLLNSYFAALGFSQKQKDTGEPSSSAGTEPKTVVFEHDNEKLEIVDPKTTSIQSIFNYLKSKHEWKEEEVEQDLLVLEQERIRTFSDLLLLSLDSVQKELKLPLTVKEALIQFINQYKETTKSQKIELPQNDSGMPRLRIHPENQDILQVYSNNQQYYQINRWCPHKGADLADGYVENNKVICPRHFWKFDLQNGGICNKKSIDACIIAKPLDW